MQKKVFSALKVLLTGLLLCGTWLTMSAQNNIRGTVKDVNGEPIIGASIMLVEDATKGTIADENGDFSLVAAAGNTLRISSIGFKTTEIKVGSQSVIDIVLETDINLLDNAVAIGYGTARKGDLTGSISSVRGETVTERSQTMLSTALQGQIAGLQVTRSGGAPGSQGTIRIHGVTTMSTNDPLVIIDGVPGSINDVVAEDVQDIAVLKDAASASIYGSRAAAGVILITTRRAQENKFSVDYNYYYAIDKPTAKPKMVGAVDWMKTVNDLKYNDGASSPFSEFTEEYINEYPSKNASDPYHYPSTDWLDVVLKKTTSHQQHTISINGGKDNLKTKFTMNYQKGDGYYDNRSYERYAGRLNNDWQVTKWLKANVDLDFSKSESISPSNNNVMYFTYVISPIYCPFWEDGSYADVKDGGNIIASIDKGGTSNTQYYKMGGKIQFDIKPFKDLTVTTIFAPRFSFTKGKTFAKAVAVERKADGSISTNQFHKTTDLSETRNDNHSYTYQAYANYGKKFGLHSVNAMVGYEGYTYEWENLGASRNKFQLDNYPYLNIGPEDFQFNSGSAGHNAYQSAFGRLMYSFKDRYMLQVNFRADGSSRFAKECRWGYFPSVSAGWVISEEPWFSNNVVSYLKLRGSWGQLGNERIGSEFPYQAAISFGNSYMMNKDGSVTALQNAAQVYYAFRDITWETTTSTGVGLDATLFDGRLRFNGDYYHKKTENMLLTLGFPSYAGFSAPDQNAGDMFTNGWDIELGWQDRIGDFSYGISANLSDYRSKMGYVGDKKTVNGNNLIEEGSYYNEWYIYKTDGLIMTNEDLTGPDGKRIPTYSNNDKAGDIKYVDVNGDGKINSDDKVKMGNSLPEYLYGGNIFMGWKNWDFNMSFQGIGRQMVMFQYWWIQPYKEQWGSVPELLVGNYWRIGDDAANKTAKYPRVTYTNTGSQSVGSDYWLFNGAYFRVKNITLGYTVPKRIMEKTFIKNLRVYANITDLPAISKFPKGWDPEAPANGDYISTSFIMGVNVKF
ncbi:MAG: TonB-dependent receptor [Bacteroidales bacterium]|nr:TonB-dependent receptor [Bacteroidales bacterium]